MNHLVIAHEEVRKVLDKLRLIKMIGFDTETTGLDPHMAKLVSVQLSDGKDAWYFPVTHKGDFNVSKESQDLLKEFLTQVPVCCFNANFDAHIVKHNWGVDVTVQHDSQLLMLILGKDQASLKWAAESLLGRKQVIHFKDLFPPSEEPHYQDLDPHNITVLAYGCDDAFNTVNLTLLLLKDLEEKELGEIYSMELKFQEVLRDMEYRGLNVSLSILAKRTADFLVDLRRMEDKFWELVETRLGEPNVAFSLGSPKKLSELLYDKLGYTCLSFTGKGGRSASVDALAMLPQDDIIRTLVEVKHCNSIYSTYLTKAGNYVHEGKVHPDHLQIGESGRPYTRNPNVQQWPIPVREAILPDVNTYFLLADFKSAELRIMAGMSNDEFLKNVFEKGLDPHRATFEAMSKVSYADVTAEQRNFGKVLNYGIIYGMEPYGLSTRLLISVDKAEELITKFFSKIPGVVKFIAEVEAEVTKTTYTKTYFGRKRHIGLIKSPNANDRKKARRQAVNTACQGSMADILKIVTNRIHHELKFDGIRICEEVHDSILFQVDMAIDPKVAMAKLGKAMEVRVGEVLMQVSFKLGAPGVSWGKLEDVK